MTQLQMREFKYPEDYPGVLRLWESAGVGVRVGPSDTPAEIQKKLQRDPDLFLVAESESQIIGTVIGGFDGRRGLVYHLAVAVPFRRRGVASQLMAEVEQRLRHKGCIRCYLLVRPDNLEAIEYYETVGWNLLDDHIFAKDLA
ncbi:MAG: GNAT family N-acetyltransferase [Chloroflexota bacterium]